MTSLIGFLQDVSLRGSETSALSLVGLVEFNLCVVFLLLLISIKPYEYQTDYYFACFALLLLIPCTQFSILDPLDTAMNAAGTEAAVTIIFCGFVFSLLYEYWGNSSSGNTRKKTSYQGKLASENKHLKGQIFEANMRLTKALQELESTKNETSHEQVSFQ